MSEIHGRVSSTHSFQTENKLCSGTVTIYTSNCSVSAAKPSTVIIEGKCMSGYSINYHAAASPEARGNYMGAGLPYANKEMAMQNSKNIGQVVMGVLGHFTIELTMPNAYYAGLGSTLVPPHVHFDILDHKGSVVGQTDVPLGTELTAVPYRSLTGLPGMPCRTTRR